MNALKAAARGTSRLGLGAAIAVLPLYFVGCAAMGWFSAAYGVATPSFDTSALTAALEVFS